jgi:hypothetical protein
MQAQQVRVRAQVRLGRSASSRLIDNTLGLYSQPPDSGTENREMPAIMQVLTLQLIDRCTIPADVQLFLLEIVAFEKNARNTCTFTGISCQKAVYAGKNCIFAGVPLKSFRCSLFAAQAS